MINLFYSPHEKNYYMDNTGNPGKCAKCFSKLEGWAVLVCQWNRKKSDLLVYCKNCFNKVKSYSYITEYKAILLSEPPYDSFPVIMRPPELCDGRNASVFDIARLESIKTTDRAKFSFRESIEGAKIGNLEYKKHNPELHKPLSEAEFDRLADSILNPKPMISNESHKLLK